MNQFRNHNQNLIRAIENIVDSEDSKQLSDLIDLDGIDLIARRLLTAEEMKNAGSFFTGQALSSRLIADIKNTITENSVILDPTCGTGNLLIEASRQLAIKKGLKDTLSKWGEQLSGYDINPSFVDAAKLRIILEAISRGANKDCSIDEAMRLLKKIFAKDTLETTKKDLKEVTHILMNPPFSNWQLDTPDYFSSGKTNAASVLLIHFIREMREGCYINAILPDVIRSGSRYVKTRKFSNDNIAADCTVWGRFNKKTNVDVFILAGKKVSKETGVKWQKENHESPTVSSRYLIKIGPLVSYRDKEEGPLAPYLHQKNSPHGKTISYISEMRRFKGKLYTPPFVVVKRTSSPKDNPRASATLVLGKKPIAVENHMVIIKPFSDCLDECFKLLHILDKESTTTFLNERIRLRHLTVKAIGEIPL
nr:N-6 DNA methylase [uncultured Halomonas sp.]